jgi:glycosyltransferase involved in cell wall biosynthesis
MVDKRIRVHDLGSPTLRKAIFPLIGKIYSLRPQVVFSTLSYVNFVLICIKFFLPIKFLLWAREANLPSISVPNNSHTHLMKFGYFFLYRFADRILCTSVRMKNEFIDNFHIPSGKIYILPNPVDDVLIRKAVSLNSISVNRKGVCFVASGRLVHQKGFDRLLHWFSKLKDKTSSLIILGNGPMEQELKSLATELSIDDRVVFTGFCDNPWKWYASADAFLLSSRWEGMSNAALEALACGTKVIATSDSGGISEVLDQACTGAVTVVATEALFQKKMDAVQESRKQGVIGDSLLPELYRLKSVVDQMEKWLR